MKLPDLAFAITLLVPS